MTTLRNRLWPPVLLFAILAFVVLALPHLLLPAVPKSSVELMRVGLTAAWAIVAFSTVGSVRTRGMGLVRAMPGERRTVVHFGLQILVGVLVIAAFVVVADLWQVSLTGIALGGAVTGVVIGLAAQSMLGNVIAGGMLLSLRPMRVGEWVSLRSWMSGGIDATGRVEEINFFYTVLRENGVRRVVPNSAVVISTIAADETQAAYTQTLVLPFSVTPETVAEALAPLRRREVVEVRQDAYVLRVEWEGDRQSRAERLEKLVAGLGPTPGGPEQAT